MDKLNKTKNEKIEKFPLAAVLTAVSSLGSVMGNGNNNLSEESAFQNQYNPWAIGRNIANKEGLSGKESKERMDEIAEAIKREKQVEKSNPIPSSPTKNTPQHYGKQPGHYIEKFLEITKKRK